jgi:periplasmic protein TonB
MEQQSVSQFPDLENGLPVGQHRRIVGIGISFFIHAFAVWSVVFISSVFLSYKPPLRIDFTIHKPYEVAKVQKPTTKVEHKVKSVSARIRQTAPPPKSLPKKVKVATAKKIVPLAAKKKLVMAPSIPAKKEEVISENVKEVLKPLPEILPEQTISSVESVDDDFKKSIAATVPAPGAEQKETKSSPSLENQYLKEHFLYIKDSIQNKISYPRMARKMGWQGRVVISFIVCTDGSVTNIQIIESSGFKALDKNAVEVIRKAAPFPKPPVAAELIIPVTYKLS